MIVGGLDFHSSSIETEICYPNMSLKGKEKSCSYVNIKFSDSEDDYEDNDHDNQESDTELGLSLEKLNLGPRKKLLVMNLNGLLLHRVHRRDTKGIPKSRTPDETAGNFLLYKRPFSEEFMKFCLERFEVGIWSSAMEHNVDAALTCAMGTLKNRLLFVWDQEELNEVWDHVKKGGPYSATNTLLIDDKPYKAFLNPPNTAIFPESYNPEDKHDKALDPEGELCLYLKGLADSHDVQFYVKDHPFGQPAITSSHPDWDFYTDVRSRLRY